MTPRPLWEVEEVLKEILDAMGPNMTKLVVEKKVNDELVPIVAIDLFGMNEKKTISKQYYAEIPLEDV